MVYYKLSLGQADKLADAVLYLHHTFSIAREEKEEKIVALICDSEDNKLNKMIKEFTNMVPYRLIRPFYQRELDYEKKVNVDFKDHQINALIDYIQRRNPNVPAIPFKIFPPADKDRNLSAETRYWRFVQEEIPLYDIYTKTEFTRENLMKHGGMSIDHFIPWSFVLHNEIWNLYPMYKNMNSGKNNKLPDKEKYLDVFCEKQYQAFIISKNWKKEKKITEQYLHVKQDIFEIDGNDRGHDAFLLAMKQTIEPLYQIANNQGYMVWNC